MSENSVLLAACLTLFAGLTTTLGGAVAFYAKRANTKFLAIALGFSAGVMIYVSMLEIMSKAKNILIEAMGGKAGNWAAVLVFFGGMLFIAVIDKFIPSFEESPGAPQTIPQAKERGTTGASSYNRKLLRMGLFTALAVGIHNFPEGLITFFSTLQNPVMGLSIAAAIAIHNIPEGIAVAAPIYYATGSRRQAFLWAFLSGIAEPIGALAGYLVLAPFLSSTVYGVIFAAVAGIMVYISFDQLLPAAREYGDHHLSVMGLIGGMALMALSLLLFL
ncbi:MAG: zinc transporter ZupT [Eubacteriales bacterium]|nr:zinc transporter ZupT [Eubacteriales bacterium]MDD3073173.1 zinc transporter ZupT [Eubacteriales bacterium]MDD4078332.1 zinc transporter ZupT [Eubacteriales bacterium]MDD4768491.1 zinc transporter ZupT [Eubacteriales bacterium]